MTRRLPSRPEDSAVDTLSPVTATATRGAGVAARVRPALTPGRIALGLVVLASLGFYLVNVAHFARQPLRIEENEWPRMAKAIYESGRPYISAADSQRLRLDTSVQPGQPLRWDDEPYIGAWHPPLYQYVSAASMVVVGSDASYALRGVGIAGMLLCALLLFLIAREVAGRRWMLIGGAAAALLLLHPYAIQGSTFLDIDTSIYPAVILLALWLALRFGKRPERLRVIEMALLAVAFALVCWTKLTTIAALAPAFALFWLLWRHPRRAVPELVVVLGGAAALFFSTYWLWTQAAGIPYEYMFDVTFGEKSDRLGGTPEQREWVFRWQVAWFLPALMILAAVYAVDAAWSFARTRRARPMDLLWGSGVAVLLMYAWVTPNQSIYQGKYALPALPLLILPVAWMCLRGVRARPPLTALAVAAAVAVVAGVSMPELTLNDAWINAENVFRTAVLAGTALALVVAWRLVPRTPFLGVGPLLVLAAVSIAQSVQAKDLDTSPLHPIPDTADFNNAVHAVNGALGPGDIALVAKDIGFYVKPEAKVVEGHDTIYRGDELTTRMMREDPRVKVWAQDSFGPQVGRSMSIALAECFALTGSFNSAFVHTRKEPGRC